jgi:anti-anti-sigma factor
MDYRYALRGEIDLAVRDTLRRDFDAVVATPGAHLLIDASAVTFIDSSGIGVIVDTHLALEADGRHMLIVNMPPDVRKPFELLGVDHLFRYERETVDPELQQSV